jgi:hypothetical protein
MKHIVAALTCLWILGIAGCGQVPPQREEGEGLINFHSARTPYAAAICIARNAKRPPLNMAAEERISGKTSWEVVVRSASGAAGTLAVAQVDPDGVGSRVSIRVTASVSGGRVSFAQQLMADCEGKLIP